MIRFLVFGDLHYDDTDDGDERINELIDKAKLERVDFIVSLGDLCLPLEKNKHILDKLKSAKVPVYHTIGNHDTQISDIVDTLDFLSLDQSFYSFECNDYKGIILDTCFWRNQNGDHHFPNKNKEPGIYPIVPFEEIEWLKRELEDNKKYIIFSHQSLINEFANRGIRNRQEVHDLLAGKNVVLCMNGHDHGTDLKIVNNIPFYTVNASSSYCWWGGNPPGSDIRNLPYRDALHVVVEIDENELRIKGIESEYLRDTPDDVGVHDYQWNGVSIRPRTSSHVLPYFTANRN